MSPAERFRRAVRRSAGRARATGDEAISSLGHRLRRRRLLVRDDGPGGPILVAVDGGGFSRYLTEILRAEGLSSFSATASSKVTAALLARFDVVLLGPVQLAPRTVADLSAWVEGGGNLVAIRPDRRLADLLGIAEAGGGEREGYLRVDTSAPPGAGICDRAMQYHGEADHYRLAGATPIAELCDRSGTPRGFPAVTLRRVGSAGGHGVAFTYDLPRSVVCTRQGNPAWAGQNRDGDVLTRSNDLFFGGAAWDAQRDWIDGDLLDVPQADEQQRLLLQLIQHVNAERRPLPRFWYLPRDLRAAVVMTGDDHALDGTAERFAQLAALDRPSDAVDDWTCARATSYVYSHSSLSDAQAAALQSQGFEICPHVSTNGAEWTRGSLSRAFRKQLTAFRRSYPSLRAPVSHRTHAVVWSDWSTQPEVERAHGIRLDTNYYLYPSTWVVGDAGFFTGSGLPMRFASSTGEVIDCYQASTQLTDESEQVYPHAIEVALDRALRPDGCVSVLTANMHTDLAASIGSDAIIDAARRRRTPIISARQLLTWLDGRAASRIGPVERSGSRLRFESVVDERAAGLTLLVPLPPGCTGVRSVTCNGTSVPFQLEVIGGVVNVSVRASSAVFEVDCSSAAPPPPTVAGFECSPVASDAVVVTWRSSHPTTGRVTLAPVDGGEEATVEEPRPRTRHAVDFGDLRPGTSYRVRIDGDPEDRTVLTMPNEPIVHQRVDELLRGTFDGTMASVARGGSLVLQPTLLLEPASKATSDGWDELGRIETSDDGRRVVSEGVLIASTPLGPGRSFEVEATLSTGADHQIGFVDAPGGHVAVAFSMSSGALAATLRAGGATVMRTIPGRWDAEPHRFRIEWDSGLTSFAIDGRTVVAERVAVHGPLRPLIGASAGGAGVSVSWARVSDFRSTGSYLSCVLDNGAVAGWGRIWVTAPAITMTGARIAVRTGNTTLPDRHWSDWILVRPGTGPLEVRSRHLQYRLELLTASPRWTPEVSAVTVERRP